MSRPSHYPQLQPNYQPRESVYPIQSIQVDFLHTLEDCVQVTEACRDTLQAGLLRLEPGTKDLPRLKKVLGNEHRFLLLPQPTIQTHLTSLSSSLAPQINNLISKAEELLDLERKKLNHLEEKYNILNERKILADNHQRTQIDVSVEHNNDDDNNEVGSNLDNLEIRELSITQRRKVAMLRNKRERLEKELNRLQG